MLRFQGQSLLERQRRPTLIGVLSVIAVIAVAAAYFTPRTKWASSGEIQVPVRVFVFNAAQARPIPNARVGLQHEAVIERELDTGDRVLSASLDELPNVDLGTTGADGVVTISHGFRTEANYKRPDPQAFLGCEWVLVEAPGYGRVAIPVGYDFAPTRTLKQKGLTVTIGLMSAERNHAGATDKSDPR